MIMFTSFNRMTYVDKDFSIHNIGDLIDDNLKLHPMGKTYNFETAIYDSCTAIQSIKSILESKNIKYTFLQSMKHNFYYDDFEAEGKVKEIKVMVRPLQAVNLLHSKMQVMLESMK